VQRVPDRFPQKEVTAKEEGSRRTKATIEGRQETIKEGSM
jgi:hypothetical protein